MGYGCRNLSFTERCYLTKGEIIELLREYEQDLKKEVQGVGQKIRELELNGDNLPFSTLYSRFEAV